MGVAGGQANKYLRKMTRLLLALLVAGLLPWSAAQDVSATDLSRLKPLPYVVDLAPLPAQTLLLRSVTCQADGKPVTQGRLYLAQLPGHQVRAARIEYNEQGKYVLEHSTTSEKAYQYYARYVTQQQPFSVLTMNTLIGMWRLFGMRFRLENVTYRCALT